MANLDIAWITAELAPYVKVGGLADVSSALPKALYQLNHDVRIILPYYGSIREKYGVIEEVCQFKDPEDKLAKIYRTQHIESGVPVYLVDHQVIGTEPYDEEDDLGEKFSTFSWIVSRIFDQINWHPDIIHCNDWHTGLLPYIVKDIPVKTFYTIHNLAFQGVESSHHLQRLDLDDEGIDTSDGNINFMRVGIQFCDKVTTVSDTYAKEILTPEYGFGLENDLSTHENGVDGIVHGIDVDEYSPEFDSKIEYNYGIDNIDLKQKNKENLREKAGLQMDKNNFLLGLVSRLYDQKGIHHLIDILPGLLENDIQVIVLGTGDETYERELQRIEYTYSENFKFFRLYDVKLSHQIFAGADAFLVPSKFEPCGLTQLYSMAYGTIPIVRHTGGLADTVHEGGEDAEGFVFHEFTSISLHKAIMRAYDVFTNDQEYWRKLQENGMTKDLTWTKPAKKWINLYEDILKQI